MPFYHALGNIPHKRHTIHDRARAVAFITNNSLARWASMACRSLLYHRASAYPWSSAIVGPTVDASPSIAVEQKHEVAHACSAFKVDSALPTTSRAAKPMLVNSDICRSCSPLPHRQEHDRLFLQKRRLPTRLLFIHKRHGYPAHASWAISDFAYGDYLVIPRGIIYQIEFDTTRTTAILYRRVATTRIYTPKRYRNWFGQLLEHSPYCERDYKLAAGPRNPPRNGRVPNAKSRSSRRACTEYTYAAHPFDVVGWDGYNFPVRVFSIHNFEPITGRVHQPPPVHQTFETTAYVMCSFVPAALRLPPPQSIPAPYNHSNIDSDEMLYYVDGDFMSRNDVAPGHISAPPRRHPARSTPRRLWNAASAKKETDELAVMVDTFKPLQVTEEALKIDDGKYWNSWVE
jgi:homogentisate 1,2-dioxygenase